MKKKFFSMKHKFVIMVASLLLCFVLATTVIWGVAFTRKISERGVEYAWEMTESANKNVSSGYALYDIDKDGVPELLVRFGDCEAADHTKIYTFRDGEMALAGRQSQQRHLYHLGN